MCYPRFLLAGKPPGKPRRTCGFGQSPDAGPAGPGPLEAPSGAAVQASRTCPGLRTTGGCTDHGNSIHASVRFHTYSHFTTDCDFS